MLGKQGEPDNQLIIEPIYAGNPETCKKTLSIFTS